MSAEALIDFLASVGEYNARTLSYQFPVKVFDLLSPMVRGFFYLFIKRGSISLDDLLNNEWREDSTVFEAYSRLSPEARLEVHAVLGFVLHETTHKVDLLISPFGVQYLAMLITEYQDLQDFIPRVLDDADYKTAFPLLRFVGQDPPPVLTKNGIRQFWARLEPMIRKAVAWGDVGDIRPNASEIERGWPEFDAPPGPLFGTDDQIELIRVWRSFYSVRPVGTGNWYLRPMTVLETKAVAATLLFLLEIAPDIRDVSRFFEAVYARRKAELPQDYLFILNILAQLQGYSDIGNALAQADNMTIRHLLIVAQSLCWYALHASPIPRDHGNAPTLSGNPALRLFCALFLYPRATQWFAAGEEPPTGAALLKWFDSHELVLGLDQLPVAETVDASRSALNRLEQEVETIWNPQVRAHFTRVIAIMKPHFKARDHYGSALGQPENGNSRDSVRSDEDQELFYHDHEPQGDYREWLELRPKIIFSRAEPSDGLLMQLDEHFQAGLVPVLCERCSTMGSLWVGRFVKTIEYVCPSCGTAAHIQLVRVKMVREEEPLSEESTSGERREDPDHG